MLQNNPSVARTGFDTAEKEPYGLTPYTSTTPSLRVSLIFFDLSALFPSLHDFLHGLFTTFSSHLVFIRGVRVREGRSAEKNNILT